MFRKYSLLAMTVLTACTLSVKAQTAEEIMDKHIAAIGGSNWDKVKTIKMVGSMSPQPGVDISMTQTLAVDKALRIDISAMGMSGWMITTKTAGWMYMPFQGGSKIDTMKADALAQQQRMMDIKASQKLNYKTDGSKLEFTGRDTINSIACYKVKMTDKDGNESTSYFDCTSYYILRTESKVKVNEEEQEVASTYSNYKKLDAGIVMPMTVNVMGQDVTFKTIDVNVPVDDNVFVPKIEDVKK